VDLTTAVFWIFSAWAIASALVTITRRNAIASAMWLVSTMFALSGLFVLLQAQFIAAIQVLVYAGAVMVLFLFVIMLLNIGHATTDMRGPAAVAATVVIAGLLVIQLVALARYSPDRLAGEVAQAPQMRDPAAAFIGGMAARQAVAEQGVVGAVAAPLFQTYLVPFELTSILLLVAIIGAVVLAKRRI